MWFVTDPISMIVVGVVIPPYFCPFLFCRVNLTFHVKQVPDVYVYSLSCAINIAGERKIPAFCHSWPRTTTAPPQLSLSSPLSLLVCNEDDGDAKDPRAQKPRLRNYKGDKSQYSNRQGGINGKKVVQVRKQIKKGGGGGGDSISLYRRPPSKSGYCETLGNVRTNREKTNLVKKMQHEMRKWTLHLITWTRRASTKRGGEDHNFHC